MAPDEFSRLADDLTAGLERYVQLEREIEDAGNRLLGHAPDTFELRTVASILEDVYTGAESICQLIVKTLDRKQPSGKHWHEELLEQVSVEASGIRPAAHCYSSITVSKLPLHRSCIPRQLHITVAADRLPLTGAGDAHRPLPVVVGNIQFLVGQPGFKLQLQIH